MLPGEDGLSLCRAVRAESDIPIIMPTAKGEGVDRVIGLELGADDDLPKPFVLEVLAQKIRQMIGTPVALREAPGETLSVGDAIG